MSSVLKADHPLLRRQQPKPLNLDDLEALAERIVSGARTRAREILVEAQEQAEQLGHSAAEAGRQEGFERGYQEGTARGREEALAKAAEKFALDQAQLLEALHGALSDFEKQRNQLLAGARDELVRLALAVARRVTKRYARSDPQVAVENLEEIIERVGQRHLLQIVVNPADAESIRRFAAPLAEGNQRWRNLAIVESAEVHPGGCRVTLPDGEIDASIETQLERIAAALLPEEAGP